MILIRRKIIKNRIKIVLIGHYVILVGAGILNVKNCATIPVVIKNQKTSFSFGNFHVNN